MRSSTTKPSPAPAQPASNASRTTAFFANTPNGLICIASGKLGTALRSRLSAPHAPFPPHLRCRAACPRATRAGRRRKHQLGRRSAPSCATRPSAGSALSRRPQPGWPLLQARSGLACLLEESWRRGRTAPHQLDPARRCLGQSTGVSRAQAPSARPLDGLRL